MTDRSYDITHLTTEQLRELYTSFRKQGWVDYSYIALREDTPPELSDAEIILNIQARHDMNMFVFMLDYEDEEDGVMIGFGLTYHEDFAAYLHLPPRLLDELVEKYHLTNSKEAKNYTINEFLIEEHLKKPLN